MDVNLLIIVHLFFFFLYLFVLFFSLSFSFCFFFFSSSFFSFSFSSSVLTYSIIVSTFSLTSSFFLILVLMSHTFSTIFVFFFHLSLTRFHLFWKISVFFHKLIVSLHLFSPTLSFFTLHFFSVHPFSLLFFPFNHLHFFCTIGPSPVTSITVLLHFAFLYSLTRLHCITFPIYFLPPALLIMWVYTLLSILTLPSLIILTSFSPPHILTSIPILILFHGPTSASPSSPFPIFSIISHTSSPSL